jgi:hypothetical protein
MNDLDLDYLLYLDPGFMKKILDEGLTDEEKLRLKIIKAQKNENAN